MVERSLRDTSQQNPFKASHTSRTEDEQLGARIGDGVQQFGKRLSQAHHRSRSPPGPPELGGRGCRLPSRGSGRRGVDRSDVTGRKRAQRPWYQHARRVPGGADHTQDERPPTSRRGEAGDERDCSP